MTTLVVLHGANGSAVGMEPLCKLLRPAVQVICPNLLGHGGRPVPERYTLAGLAEDLAGQLDELQVGPAYFLGYSVGGMLAAYLARHQPQRVLGIITLATHHRMPPEAAAHMAYLCSLERFLKPGNPRTPQLKVEHGPDNWERMLPKLKVMFEEFAQAAPMDEADLRQLRVPALLLNGQSDQLVPQRETQWAGQSIPGARVGFFPGYAHPLGMIPLAPVAQYVVKWISTCETQVGGASPTTPSHHA